MLHLPHCSHYHSIHHETDHMKSNIHTIDDANAIHDSGCRHYQPFAMPRFLNAQVLLPQKTAAAGANAAVPSRCQGEEGQEEPASPSAVFFIGRSTFGSRPVCSSLSSWTSSHGSARRRSDTSVCPCSCGGQVPPPRPSWRYSIASLSNSRSGKESSPPSRDGGSDDGSRGSGGAVQRKLAALNDLLHAADAVRRRRRQERQQEELHKRDWNEREPKKLPTVLQQTEVTIPKTARTRTPSITSALATRRGHGTCVPATLLEESPPRCSVFLPPLAALARPYLFRSNSDDDASNDDAFFPDDVTIVSTCTPLQPPSASATTTASPQDWNTRAVPCSGHRPTPTNPSSWGDYHSSRPSVGQDDQQYEEKKYESNLNETPSFSGSSYSSSCCYAFLRGAAFVTRNSDHSLREHDNVSASSQSSCLFSASYSPRRCPDSSGTDECLRDHPFVPNDVL